jgi:hypothetical protein
MKVVLGTKCLIDAADPASHAHAPVQKILGVAASGRLDLFVSRQSLSELVQNDPVTVCAHAIADTLGVLPHFPVGAWKDQVCTWDQVSGTWGDMRRNDGIQSVIADPATAGNDIRDRGAYIDALHNKADMFVTSDKHLGGSGPADRLEKRFGLRVCSPSDLVSELGL